jgi:sucrose-6F-phosphate phosphohydrolase
MSWLLVSDVDDTLTGDDAALVRLGAAFAAAPSLTVAYNSSRPCASVRQTIAANPALPVPDFLIGALGTEIEDGRSGERLEEYTAVLNKNWQRDAVVAIATSLDFRPHEAVYQTPLKASYDIADEAAYQRFMAEMARAGLRAKVIFSNRIKLDIVPEMAGKGSAIRYLVERLGLPADRAIVAGDSGNDRDMFQTPFRGVVVGNADADLKALQGDHIYFAHKDHAAGVLEGLGYWGVLTRQGE